MKLSEKHDGYLFKIEHSIVGHVKKKYWFVIPFNSPTLYWFKNATDFECAGQISLSGAAFTYDPREIGIFEIHVNNEIYILEAINNEERLKWLSVLQLSRKQYYEINEALDKERFSLSSSKSNLSDLNSPDKDCATINFKTNELPSCSQSTFYLDEFGELNNHSLCVPNKLEETGTKYFINLEERLFRTQAVKQNSKKSFKTPSKKIIHKARETLKMFSDAKYNTNNTNQTTKCEKYLKKIELMTQLKNRCYELTDELVANQDLVKALKKSLITAQNQRDAIVDLCKENVTIKDKLDLILERESALTTFQCTVTKLRREVEQYKEENKALQIENNSLNVMIDAYKESIKTKDELIVKLCDNSNIMSPTSNQSKNKSIITDEAEVPEGIIFDSTSVIDDSDVKKVLAETSVNDINEMKDLVDGYSSQNKFLSDEVIALQKIIQSLEEREKKLIRQNFNIEAVYYQLKSRYIMVLNHFRLSNHPHQSLDTATVQKLIDEVARPSSIKFDSCSSTNVENRTESLVDIIDPKSYASMLLPYKNLSSILPLVVNAETDSLGFYLNSPKSRCQTPLGMLSIKKLTTNLSNSSLSENEQEALNNSLNDHSNTEVVSSEDKDLLLNQSKKSQILQNNEITSQLISTNTDLQNDWMVRIAADLKKRSDDIRENISLGNDKEYIEWLQRWDAYLVNHVLQPLSGSIINSKLKPLIRFGIPHAYRSRIWKSLVTSYVKSTKLEMGKGYYNCLLKKAEKVAEEGTDSALRQIDLDLNRTLPTNKQFDKEDSEKAQALKRVLYAFRFHNKVVEYCQGLNRIAAIGLLYLKESDAFWFLVACVEHLQPSNYYCQNLLGAIIDQKILVDLVQKKLPTLWEHLRKLNVDLSLFTLSWFLTIFVDTLKHNIYINIFDIFLYEGNKIMLFRFALTLLKLCEPKVLECTSLSGVQASLSNLANLVVDFKEFANIAFKNFNPLSIKTIESKRQTYLAQLKYTTNTNEAVEKNKQLN